VGFATTQPSRQSFRAGPVQQRVLKRGFCIRLTPAVFFFFLYNERPAWDWAILHLCRDGGIAQSRLWRGLEKRMVGTNTGTHGRIHGQHYDMGGFHGHTPARWIAIPPGGDACYLFPSFLGICIPLYCGRCPTIHIITFLNSLSQHLLYEDG